MRFHSTDQVEILKLAGLRLSRAKGNNGGIEPQGMRGHHDPSGLG